MAQATKSRLSGFWVPLVVTTAALAVACSGSSFTTEGSSGGSAGSAASGGNGGSAASGGNAGGVAGSSGSGGSAGSGGTAGNPAECPAKPPERYAPCDLPVGASCQYRVQCQSGSYPINFKCGGAGDTPWTVEPSACEYAYDSCPGTALSCYAGAWRMDGGTDPPPPCPAKKPAPSSSCKDSWVFGPNTCGYPCENSAEWTVGTCHYPSAPMWAFDGTCENDCSALDVALLNFVQANQTCVQNSDCQMVSTSGCSARPGHCSGVFYVNTSVELKELEQLDTALAACRKEGCAVCQGLPPAAACNSGMCGPDKVSP